MVQESWSWDHGKVPIQDFNLFSFIKHAVLNGHTAHTKGCLENRCGIAAIAMGPYQTSQANRADACEVVLVLKALMLPPKAWESAQPRGTTCKLACGGSAPEQLWHTAGRRQRRTGSAPSHVACIDTSSAPRYGLGVRPAIASGSAPSQRSAFVHDGVSVWQEGLLAALCKR